MAFHIDARQVVKGLGETKLRTMHATEVMGRAAAAKLEADAKQNAPWTDRTGMARQTIQGVCDWEGDKLRVGVAGNMEYSPYLEFTNDKKNAVLFPTIERNAPEMLVALGKVVR